MSRDVVIGMLNPMGSNCSAVTFERSFRVVIVLVAFGRSEKIVVDVMGLVVTVGKIEGVVEDAIILVIKIAGGPVIVDVSIVLRTVDSSWSC